MARPYTYDNLETFGVSLDGSNWHYFPAKSLKESDESLASEDSGRTLDGVMHIYWVQRDLKKIEIVLPPCTSGLLNELKNLVQGKEYYIRWKSFEGGWLTRYVYTSNLNADMYSGVLYGGLWQDFEFHAIELGS
jgi:hypothetical protein